MCLDESSVTHIFFIEGRLRLTSNTYLVYYSFWSRFSWPLVGYYLGEAPDFFRHLSTRTGPFALYLLQLWSKPPPSIVPIFYASFLNWICKTKKSELLANITRGVENELDASSVNSLKQIEIKDGYYNLLKCQNLRFEIFKQIFSSLPSASFSFLFFSSRISSSKVVGSTVVEEPVTLDESSEEEEEPEPSSTYLKCINGNCG